MSNVPSTAARVVGSVKWFNEPHGFGFIARDDGRPDCFVHRFDFRGGELSPLLAGERVEFAVVERAKGPWADDVTRLSPRARSRGEAPTADRAPRVLPTATRRRQAVSPHLRVLSRGECEAVLARNSVGRIALAHRGRVSVSPSNYVYVRGWLFARADHALRIAIAHNPWVVFEVAEVEGVSDWRSVVVCGACYTMSPTGIAAGDAAMADGVVRLRETVPEMTRDGQAAPFVTEIFRMHADEMVGYGARSAPETRRPRRQRNASRHRARE